MLKEEWGRLRSTRALNRMKIPPVTAPISLEFLWLRLHVLSYDERVVNHRMHSHSFYELHISTDGQTCYRLEDGGLSTLLRGQYLLLPPGVRHVQESHDADHVRFSLAFSLSEQELDEKGIHLPRAATVGQIDERGLVLLEEAARAAIGDPLLAPYAVQGLCLRLFMTLVERRGGDTARAQEKGEDLRLMRAKRYLADNLRSSPTVREVAAYVHLSERQLERLFQENEHISVRQFIRLERCEAAKELLAVPDLPLSDVAEQLGFSCVYNFIRFFREVEGMTPGAFRRMMG